MLETAIPDLTGYTLEKAAEKLRALNVDYTVSETTSPRNDVEGTEKRVARCVVKEDTICLTLCRY